MPGVTTWHSNQLSNSNRMHSSHRASCQPGTQYSNSNIRQYTAYALNSNHACPDALLHRAPRQALPSSAVRSLPTVTAASGTPACHGVWCGAAVRPASRLRLVPSSLLTGASPRSKDRCAAPLTGTLRGQVMTNTARVRGLRLRLNASGPCLLWCYPKTTSGTQRGTLSCVTAVAPILVVP